MVEGKGFVGRALQSHRYFASATRQNVAERSIPRDPAQPFFRVDPGGERATPPSLSRTRAYPEKNARRIFDDLPSPHALEDVSAPRNARPAISVLSGDGRPLSASQATPQGPSARQSRTAFRLRFCARGGGGREFFATNTRPAIPIAPRRRSLP